MRKIKQMLMTIAVLLCSATANAYDFEVDGIYYNILSMSDLTVEVTEGDNKYSGEVIIPSTVSYKSKTLTVTSIEKYAFYGCESLTSVTIGNSVTSIGDYAFINCTSLKDLRIEDGETTLSLGYNSSNSYGTGEGLFYDCPLESLYLGRNIQYETGTKYGYSPFYGKTSLKSVTIGNSVTSIGSSAFDNCSGLTSVTIPNSVTSIGSSAFWDCSGLTSITIPNSVTSIGSSAFRDCGGLTSITIPNSVTSIGNCAFSNCTSLKDLRIEDGETTLSLGYNTYYEGLFYDCPLESLYLGRNIQYETGYSSGYSPFFGNKALKSVTIGNSVTSIGNYAFYNCKGLASVTIPNSVTSIEKNAFYGCESLTSVTIGNSVTSIGNYAFYNCKGLASVTIPNSVTSIGDYAFSACDSLASIRLLGETPPTVGSNSFTNKQYLNTIVYVPKGTLATYQAADTWKNFWDIQEFDVTAIKNVEDVTPAFEITSSGIQFTAADGKAIAIYAPNGALVEKIDNYVGEEITLDRGVYIVRVGNKTMKVKL